MKKASNTVHLEPHPNSWTLILVAIKRIWLIAFLVPPIALAQQRMPRWMVELPAEPGCYLAIGECGNYSDRTMASEEARRVAAFRLAASMHANIRYGLADEQDGVVGWHVSFAEVSVDTSVMEQLIQEMVVLDSVHLEDGLHLLVGYGTIQAIADRNKEFVTNEVGIPDWVKNPPSSHETLYGVGSSWKRGADGWEDAERKARVALAEQIVLDVKTGAWSYQSGWEGGTQVVSNQKMTLTLTDTQIIGRGRDQDGVAFVLVRMPISGGVSER